MNSTAPVLFESSSTAAVVNDPANAVWVAVLRALSGPGWEVFRRRYHAALNHFRSQPRRPRTADHVVQISAATRAAAERGLLSEVFSGGPPQAPMFAPVGPGPELRRDLPPCLANLSVEPPPLATILYGPGRPPTDGLCLLRAFMGTLALGHADTPTSVHTNLHANPTFAEQCGFTKAGARKAPDELTCRRLPTSSVLEEFDTVMAGYGLWHCEQLARVRENIATGVLLLDGHLIFDTTHIDAASACESVAPPPTEEDPKPASRKVGHLHKRCGCGKAAWEGCPHPWEQTDPGAAVVVKGPTRKHWAHKLSIVAMVGDIPISARALSYAATHDGKTLLEHFAVLNAELPEVVEATHTALADRAYIGNKGDVWDRYNVLLMTGIASHKAPARLTERYPGIARFTPSGVPICHAGHSFDFRGRDIKEERFIWQAPQDDDGKPVCAGCPHAAGCLLSSGKARHLRVPRTEFPQIDWEHPQHAARRKVTYALRTGVERAIKRLKIDLGAEHLAHRGATRVQAHVDRRMLLLHILLAADPSP
jgi:hypothetical protein